MVGKGGVGKTTTAGALALALADRGSRTHLISTDPAHSLGDLFETALPPGQPIPSPCTGTLTLETLDAEGYARRWTESARAPLVELFDRGTYLDREDLEGFLDLSLPGVDEVAGVLRLAELADADFDRIVVDTAPTGHTLRLLDAGDIVGSWSEAFDAMAEKAAAVIGQLTRRPVRLAAEDVTEELQRNVERFREQVLQQAQAVLVDRAGVVVQAESARLQSGLEARGLEVALRVRVAAAAPPGAFEHEAQWATGSSTATATVPFRAGLVGCEGLRGWGEGVPHVEPRRAGRGGGSAAALLRSFPPLLLFVGKGGVGKSTCAAAAALVLAQQEHVLLLGTDPAAALGDVLRLPMDDGEARPTPSLRVRQVRAAVEFAELARRYRDSVERAFDAVGLGEAAALDRRVVEGLLGFAPPGVDEVFALTALLGDGSEAAAGRRTVVDTAPTGHFLRLLAMPMLALRWTHQLLRVIRKYRAALGLDAFAERLLVFAKELRELNLALSNPERSAAVVVTQPGPLVEAESQRLIAQVQAVGVRVAAVIANRDAPTAAVLEPPAGVPLLRAPELPEPPVGVEALERFADGWAVANR